MEPASYPPKNTEEMEAVVAFLGLLDLKRVKPDTKFLDKVPNVDGSVELVDEQQKPIGELKVQIKKIPSGSLQFDCPIELVGYSTRVCSPFILVCVDVECRKAYWCHLSPVMAGLKSEQKTFTVKFQPLVDEVGPGFPYFDRWKMLCSEYLGRVSKYPKLKQLVDEGIGLSKLASDDRKTFQQFIDEVNVLLDVDLPIVKHEYFADAWKLGVSIHQADTDVVCFSIYTVLNGENAPLLTHVPRVFGAPNIVIGGKVISGVVALQLEGMLGADISMQWLTRTQFGDPKKAARAFVFQYLSRLFSEKRLHVHGVHQSMELLMCFTLDYAHALGLPVANSYKTTDLAYGLSVFLPMWYALAFPKVMNYFHQQHSEALRNNPLPSFEQIANRAHHLLHPAEAEVHKAIASHRPIGPSLLRTDSFSIHALWQAVEFLKAANVVEISRSDRPPSKEGAWVWDCYSPEDLMQNIVLMLHGAVEDYADFVKGNRFERLNSSLISHDIALVFVADPRKWQGRDYGPVVDGYWVENTDRSLPLMTFIDQSKEPESFRHERDRVIINAVSRKWSYSWHPISSCFQERRRMQAVLYNLLEIELKRRYGEKLVL